jgi:hypothetical protein
MKIVLDKSYLQGARTEQVISLCMENNVLMPEALFYELLTTTVAKRTACFAKLPDVDNPVVLIPNVGTIMRFEVNNKVPCKHLTKLSIDVQYKFNKGLRNEKCTLPQEIVAEWMDKIREEVTDFKRRSEAITYWFPSLANYHPGQNNSLVTAIHESIASDENLIKKIYAEIRNPDFPESDIIGPDWMLFRWLQIQLFAAVEYVRRFGLDNLSLIMNSIEHDYLDIQYCITGVQVGALASKDRGMINMFKKVCPTGVLIGDL